VLVDAGDGVAEVNRDAVGEAGREQEDPLLAEQGSSPAASAVVAASQSTAAMWVSLLVPWRMKRLVKSLRRRNVPFAMRSPTPASSG